MKIVGHNPLLLWIIEPFQVLSYSPYLTSNSKILLTIFSINHETSLVCVFVFLVFCQDSLSGLLSGKFVKTKIRIRIRWTANFTSILFVFWLGAVNESFPQSWIAWKLSIPIFENSSFFRLGKSSSVLKKGQTVGISSICPDMWISSMFGPWIDFMAKAPLALITTFKIFSSLPKSAGKPRPLNMLGSPKF